MLPMTKPKKGSSPQRKGKNLNVNIQAELRDALDKMVEKSRRTLTTEISIALEEYLGKNGLWPPEEDGE